ncbi:hypothetical protein pphageT12_51 [Pseudomonas phage pphageT12]|nr:hypothetical protein pphageT12_51 [Pseudomonas phage pphageT12]
MAEKGPLQIKRGNTAQINAITPAAGEPVLDLTTMSLKLGDGATLGGVPLSLVASALKLATARSISVSGDISGSVSFDGSSNVSMSAALAATGITPGTYARVTIDANGRATNGAAVLPVNAGGTGATTAAAALSALGGAPLASPTFTGTVAAPTPAVGNNSTQVATTAMIQSEIVNKRAWTSYTPTITPASGTYTAASATGRYMVAFGICYVQIALTVTTKGTGTFPTVSLPLPALAGSANHVIPCRENNVSLRLGQGKITSGLNGLQLTAYDSNELTADGTLILVNGAYPIA